VSGVFSSEEQALRRWNLFRVIFGVEAGVTLIAGLQAIFLPALFQVSVIGPMFASDVPHQARMLGAAWVVMGVMEARMLDQGNHLAWSIYLPPILVGDLLHMVALVAMVLERGVLPADGVLFAMMAIILPCRLMVLARPERVLRVREPRRRSRRADVAIG
jgi:hypothetical protein